MIKIKIHLTCMFWEAGEPAGNPADTARTFKLHTVKPQGRNGTLNLQCIKLFTMKSSLKCLHLKDRLELLKTD